jgi:hypothetical protein
LQLEQSAIAELVAKYWVCDLLIEPSLKCGNESPSAVVGERNRTAGFDEVSGLHFAVVDGLDNRRVG